MCGSAKNTQTVTQMTTPKQRQAESMLMSKAMQGQATYNPNDPANQKFNVTPAGWDAFIESLANPESSDTLGLYDYLRGAIATGNPVDQTASFQAQRAVAETAATRSAENVMGRAGQTGAKYGSAAAGAATAAAGSVQQQAEAAILQQVVAAEEAAQQRRQAASQLAASVLQANKALQLDAARISTSINQFNAGMNYEEWKRVNPDVYQLLQAVWGRQVDQLVQNQQGWLGPALQVVGTIVGALIGGPGGAAAGSGVGAAAGNFVGTNSATGIAV